MADAAYQRARAKVQRIKGFYIHAAVYVLVTATLAAIDVIKSPDDLWFYWVALGWGCGVALHAFVVFGGKLTRGWEERKVRELMHEDRVKATQRDAF